VVGVGVRKEDGIEALHSGTQGLLAKIGRRINDNVLTIAREKQ
jgi:hypothetical protein